MASEQTIPVIAIDGPSASGKGTVAQMLARALGFHYLNSGALYRTVALAALESGADLEDELTLRDIAMNLMAKFEGESVQLGGRDVTDLLRSEAVSLTASRIAGYAAVRAALLDRQRAFRRAPGLIADGRDMGTVVFPDATLKIFLTASAEERAQRRYKQLIDKGMDATMATLLQDIRERDERDSSRAAAPLRQSADAVPLDTTRMSVEEVVEQVLALYKKARPAP